MSSTELGPSLGPTIGNLLHRSLDVLAGQGSNRHSAKERADVRLNPATVGFDGRRFLGLPMSGQQPTGLDIGEVAIAKVGQRHFGAGPPGTPVGQRIAAADHLSEQADRLLASRLWGPRAAMMSDSDQPLPPIGSPVDQDVTDRGALPPTSTKSDHHPIPDRRAGPKGADIAQPDPPSATSLGRPIHLQGYAGIEWIREAVSESAHGQQLAINCPIPAGSTY
jgi:hypothetical protein